MRGDDADWWKNLDGWVGDNGDTDWCIGHDRRVVVGVEKGCMLYPNEIGAELWYNMPE